MNRQSTYQNNTLLRDNTQGSSLCKHLLLRKLYQDNPAVIVLQVASRNPVSLPQREDVSNILKKDITVIVYY